MKLEQIKEIVDNVEEETSMSQAMLKLIESRQLELQVKNKGYVPDAIEKVVNWLEETYDEVKVFVPFKDWYCPVLDRNWLNSRRDEIEVRFATGGVFIRLEDFKRYVKHSIESRYASETIESFRKSYDKLTEDEGIELGFGKLEEDSPYVKAFGDSKIKLMKSFIFKTRSPIEIVDAGTRIVLEKLSNSRKLYSYEHVRDQIKNKSLLTVISNSHYIEDATDRVYKLDPKFNFVKISLIGDTRGDQTKDKIMKADDEESKRKAIEEFLARKNGRVA